MYSQVLAETKSPRRYFPKYTVLALGITAVLFMLVNIAYVSGVLLRLKL
jgi:amino acid transporter